MRKREVMYMAITPDKLQLPIFYCFTLKQLARWAERPVNEIIELLRSKKIDKINRCRYIKITIKWRSFESVKNQ